MNENKNFLPKLKITKIKILKLNDLPKIPLLQSTDISKRKLNSDRKLINKYKIKQIKTKENSLDNSILKLKQLIKNKTYKTKLNKSMAQLAKYIAEKNMTHYLSKYYDVFDRPFSINHEEDESKTDNYNIKENISEENSLEENNNEKRKVLSERPAYKLKQIKRLKKNYSQEFITARNRILKDEKKIKEYEKVLMKNRLNRVKINIKNISYRDPLSSFNAVSQNKLIYSNILNNYKGIMISEYAKTIDELNPIINIIDNNKNLNIKVFPSISKSMGINEKHNYLDDEFMFDSETNILEQSNIEKKLNKKLLDKSLLFKRNRLYLLKNAYQYPNKNFPGSLSEFSITQGPDESILFGGQNSSKNPIIWKFKNNDISWEIIKPEEHETSSRYGHTAILKNGNLYVYGGVYLDNKRFANLDIFNFSTKKWFSPIFNTKNIFDLRKNHVACGVGNMMFIHGGINENEEYLNDCYLLNYQPLQWKIILLKKSRRIPCLAYHSCCLVVPKEIREDPTFTLYKDISEDKLKNSNIKEMGIYIFGGKMSENGSLNKDLYVLKIGKRVLEWVILNTFGVPPKKRYGASMSYYELGNFLIIHGGRNSNKLNYAYNDTFILDLYSLNWMKVEYFDKSKIVEKRFFHQSFIENNSFFVFGGINESNFIGSEMFILELDSHKKCLKKREEYNILKILKKSKNEEKVNEEKF